MGFARTLRRLRDLALLLTAVVVVTPGPAAALDVRLVAKQFTMTMPDGSVVPMWGYAKDADGNLMTDGGEVPTVPGPRITVPPGDGTLNIHLRNDLPAGPGALRVTSIVLIGQVGVLAPVRIPAPGDTRRARSFTMETQPCNGVISAACIETYTWTGVKSGTYLYGSGTQSQVQEQMGLYGAMTKDAAAGTAYPGHPYDHEVVLIYSEVDPALHAAVVAPNPALTYGSSAYPSTLDYKPKWFLVNGTPFTAAQGAVLAGDVNKNILLRLLNAGLRTHTPQLLGSHLKLIAEDGNLYPFPRYQYSVLLPALKTTDAIWKPTTGGTYPIYDRSHDLTNAGAFGGGMLTRLFVGGAHAPVANPDAANTTANAAVVINVVANDTDVDGDLNPATVAIVSPPAQGAVAVNPDGTVRYTPNPAQTGTFTFTYTVKDLLGLTSNAATVTVTVTGTPNNPPVAQNDSKAFLAGTVSTVINVTLNDTDSDGTIDKATVTITVPPTRGTVTVLTGANRGKVRYRPNPGFQAGSDTFRYTVKDNRGAVSNEATVTVRAQ